MVKKNSSDAITQTSNTYIREDLSSSTSSSSSSSSSSSPFLNTSTNESYDSSTNKIHFYDMESGTNSNISTTNHIISRSSNHAFERQSAQNYFKNRKLSDPTDYSDNEIFLESSLLSHNSSTMNNNNESNNNNDISQMNEINYENDEEQLLQSSSHSNEYYQHNTFNQIYNNNERNQYQSSHIQLPKIDIISTNNSNEHIPNIIDSTNSISSSPNNQLAKSSDSLKKKSTKSRYKVLGLLSLVLIITQLLGIFMFSRGFFPRKSMLEGYNSFEQYPTSCVDNNIKVEPQFGKLVFMVVDAFRSSFIFGEDQIGMNYTKSLIDSGKTHSFIARASAPTVTLPRIKALVSGGIPSFVDFIYNFNSKDLNEDNLLYQMKQSNKSMIFFGDDTWLKLFPNHFKRSDGTTSFYVADTIEVDNNVTRHLEGELENDDWDAMFLHYLGLDHIGHLEGPYSPLMGPKQEELDSIIKFIHQKIIKRDEVAMSNYLHAKQLQQKQQEEQQEEQKTDSTIEKPLPTLFIVCSDHGMNEIGNHGGSSDSETSTILIMMSSLYDHQNDLKKPTSDENENGMDQHHDESSTRILLPFPPKPPSEINQVDLVPSLAMLLNLPIPINSLGRLVPELFEKFLPEEQYLRSLEINCQQQIRILMNNPLFWKNDQPAKPKIAEIMKLFTDAQQYHSSWSVSPTHSHFHENAAGLYIQFLDELQSEFSTLLTSFDDNLLIIGILLIGSSALVTLMITIATIAMSDHQVNLEIKGVAFALSFIGFVILLLGIHFTVICTDDSLHTNTFCTEEFRFGILSFVFTALSLLIGFNVFISRNNLKLLAYPSLSPLQLRKEKYIIIAGTILHLISLFGSSLVEEEHQTWYFLTTSVILLQLAPHSVSILYKITNHSPKLYKESWKQMIILIGILFGLRIVRVWNQTGIKWLDDQELLNEKYIDVAKFLTANNSISYFMIWFLSLVSVVSPLLYVFRVLDKLKHRRSGVVSQLCFLYKVIIVLCSISIFCYKWEYIPVELLQNVYIARLVYIGLAFLMLITITLPFFCKNERSNSNSTPTPTWFIITLKYVPILIVVNFTMLFLLLHKTHNMFLFTILGAISHYYLKYLLEDTGRRARSGMTGVIVGFICINWLGQFGYFAFGNSNSLSTIDISGAYTGLIDYNQYLVGILTFVIGYSSPIFFFFVSISYYSGLAIKTTINNHSSEPTLNSSSSASDILEELQWYSLVGSLLDGGIKWTNVFVFSVCILIQRYHLFIWTVFSPKYIYEVFDVILVLVKALLLLLFILYLRIIVYTKENYDKEGTSNKEE